MNGNIKQLMKEATSYTWAGENAGVVEELDAELFGRLIVENCAKLCADIDGGENMFSRAIRGQFGE